MRRRSSETLRWTLWIICSWLAETPVGNNSFPHWAYNAMAIMRNVACCWSNADHDTLARLRQNCAKGSGFWLIQSTMPCWDSSWSKDVRKFAYMGSSALNWFINRVSSEKLISTRFSKTSLVPFFLCSVTGSKWCPTLARRASRTRSNQGRWFFEDFLPTLAQTLVAVAIASVTKWRGWRSPSPNGPMYFGHLPPCEKIS